jgi:hypothetical protein
MGLSLFFPNQAHNGLPQQHWGVEIQENESSPIPSYRRTNICNVYVIELVAGDKFDPVFQVIFSMYAGNLTLHKLMVNVRATRN